MCRKEIVFQQKPSEKAEFIVKMTGPAMVRPASSNKWKAPLVFRYSEECARARDAAPSETRASPVSRPQSLAWSFAWTKKKDKTARSLQIPLKWLWRYSFKHPFSFYGSALTEKSTPLKFLSFKVMVTLPSCASFSARESSSVLKIFHHS